MPTAACSARQTRPAEKRPVSTEPASQRRLTRRRSGGPLGDVARIQRIFVAEIDGGLANAMSLESRQAPIPDYSRKAAPPKSAGI